jgi:hypothetical protein
VLALNKALYGLRRALRVWYAKLHTSLSSLGFMRSDHKHAVYTGRVVSRLLVVGVYVDDLLIVGPVDDDINKFKTKMQERFCMSEGAAHILSRDQGTPKQFWYFALLEFLC